MSNKKITNNSFKQAMGSFVTGVVIVTTAKSAKKLHGITINSFASLSLEPPMVLFNIDKNSHSYETFTKAKYFTANILEEKQSSLSKNFSHPSTIDWKNVEYHIGETRCPVLKGAISYVECKLEKLYDGGDHTIIVGHVINTQTNSDAKPLIYFRGEYQKN